MPHKLGRNCKAYRNTGTFATPTWNEIPSISDATLNQSREEIQVSTRASKVSRMFKGNINVDFACKHLYNTDDEDSTAITDAIYGEDPLDLLILTGPRTENGNTGVRGEFHVMQGNQGQNLADGVQLDLVFKPAQTANPFQTVEVASGAPVFTDL